MDAVGSCALEIVVHDLPLAKCARFTLHLNAKILLSNFERAWKYLCAAVAVLRGIGSD